MVGNARLTFEELLTVVAQIESILYPRPIVPLSFHVTDFKALTPGHFLNREAYDSFHGTRVNKCKRR